MIKAVIFDLGGVYFTEGRGIAVEKISGYYGIPREAVDRTLTTRSEIGTLYRRGEITSEEFWSRATKEWGIREDYGKLAEMWASSYETNADVVDIVKRLKTAGIKLFFLSDIVKEHAEYQQEKYHFSENFTGGIFSYVVHKIKSDGEDSFRVALAKTGERAVDVAYTDDKEEFVEIARKVGMNAILFRNANRLEMELKSLGLEF